ncbi:hypothetical protein QZH41_001043 [Actinostola sp. cb2023]|nr:hypothetical protein QZH41_001043 [Actinostola sp. cb2023]
MFRKISRKSSKTKAGNKDQDELNKQGNLHPEKVLPDIAVLINERDYLLEEVKSLREQLGNESVRYKELKSLKSQQVCALTFKLAKAIRDKERACEEKERVYEEIDSFQNKNAELEEQNEILRDKLRGTEIEYTRLSNEYEEERNGMRGVSGDEDDKAQSPKNVLPRKMSFFAVTGILKNNNINENIDQKNDVEENPNIGGETEKVENHVNEDQDSLSPDMSAKNFEKIHNINENVYQEFDVEESPNIGGDPQKENHVNEDQYSLSPDMSAKNFVNDEDIVAEFRKIQQELIDVKKNMSIVQALNERLSNDLQLLDVLKKARALSRSDSERSRKNACSDFSDCTDGGTQEAKIFVFPGVSVEKPVVLTIDKEQEHSAEELGSTPSTSTISNENDTEEVVGEIQHKEEETPDKSTEERKMTASDNSGMDMREQLQKAMKELEEIRTDNREMKQQMRKMSKSTIEHDDFLRRTTQFTGNMLREMKDREEQRSRKTSEASQPSLSVLGTRLDEIMKTVDHMTHDPAVAAQKAPIVLAPIPRHATGIPTTPSAFSPVISIQDTTLPSSTPNQKRKHTMKSKLGEPSFNHERLTSGVGDLRKTIEPLLKEWKSTEALPAAPPTNFTSGSLGYRDYIQRHIVMSSSSIAKIRDLTPEELNNGQIRY